MTSAEILEAVDPVAYIGQYTDLELKADGDWWGLSPFTDEQTPSFSVNPEMRSFYDFSSGKSGNLVEFVKEYHNCSIPEAYAKLRQFAGLTEQNGDNPTSRRLASAKIAKTYKQRQRVAKEQAPALNENYLSRYRWSPEKLQPWADEGISYDVMRAFGVRYDPLDNRIVYPIRDTEGQLRCVSGRTCDPDYKAKKLRKYTYTTPIGCLPILFGLYEHKQKILEKKEAMIFEGCKSVLKCCTWGMENGVALLTSHLSQPQFRLLIQLASYHGVTLVFALDSDVDITKDREIMNLCKYAHVEWVKNQDGLLEPKEAPVDRGLEVWNQLYERRVRLS